MNIVQLLLAPSNAVCDWFGVKDEHERGMIRQLVNGLGSITIIATAFFAAWMLGVR